MNNRVKLLAAACGVFLAVLMTSQKGYSDDWGGGGTPAPPTIKVSQCVGPQDRVCFVEGNREARGIWTEISTSL